MAGQAEGDLSYYIPVESGSAEKPPRDQAAGSEIGNCTWWINVTQHECSVDQVGDVPKTWSTD